MEQFEDSADEGETENSIPDYSETDNIQGVPEKLNKEDFVVLNNVLKEASRDQELHFEISESKSPPKNIILNNLNTQGSQSSSNEIFIVIQNENGMTTTISENDTIRAESLPSIPEEEEAPQTIKSMSYVCSYCSLDFVRKKSLQNHMKRCTVKNAEIPEETSNFTCNFCDKKFSRKLNLEKHLTICTSKEPTDKNHKPNEEEKSSPMSQKCRFCQSVFANERTLKYHESSGKCLQFSVDCEICQKSFDSKENLEEHKKKDHQKSDINCLQCGEKFETTEQLTKHSSEVHLKKYVCTYCSRSFGMLSTLKDHIRTHTKEKPYICKICSKGFSQNTNLKQHLARHNQLKPFKCSECENSFVSKGGNELLH